jgi:hypothetical protein
MRQGKFHIANSLAFGCKLQVADNILILHIDLDVKNEINV